MNNLKSLTRDWLPPAIIRLVTHLRKGGIEFEGEYSTWDEAATQSTGYDSANILEKVLAATLEVKHGRAVFERDSVLFDEVEYVWPVIAGLMWAAAKNNGRLDVLDFGGALGSGYFQNRTFLDVLPQVSWSVIEQDHYVLAGLKYVQDKTLKFYSSINLCLAENKPNVALLSSVLEYLPDPITCLESVAKLGADIVIVDRTLISTSQTEIITTQKVNPKIFSATLPCRIIASGVLINTMKKLNYDLLVQYPSLGGIGNKFSYQGFIFIRKNDEMPPL
jgi:putative methyltransferase (TIGR04325 family)